MGIYKSIYKFYNNLMTERVFAPLPTGGEADIKTMPPGGEYVQSDISTVTALYRFENYIPLVTDAALDAYSQRDEAARPFTVLSVGCSIGAEVDTVLSHVTQTAPGVGSIMIRGYDVNNEALAHARRGLYEIEYRGDLSLLDQFDISPREGNAAHAFMADSTGLRRKHDVAFDNIDLSKTEIPNTVPEADLILCNRVLGHMNFRRSEPLIRGMHHCLRASGILSIGGMPIPVHNDMAKNVLELIQSELGLRPILWSRWLSQENPFVFRKP